jgi:hypothetical protein
MYACTALQALFCVCVCSSTANVVPNHMSNKHKADTLLLFLVSKFCRGLASATPSLTHLAEQLLGKQLRGGSGSSSSSSSSGKQQQQPHDSVEDASAALSLVKVELERLRSDEGPTPPLPPPAVKVQTAYHMLQRRAS